jgi:phosphatidylethanolamine/phosphatidyl-N-methylethanolamine N-methyltransferase
MLSELGTFVKQAILQPRQTSSLVPSSRFLARAMAAHVGPHSGKVVEFGPGTGNITKAILERGVAPHDLTLFEMNPDFAESLHRRFQDANIHVTGAQNVAEFMGNDVGVVVSGLPLLSIPRPIRHAIVNGAFKVLRPGGSFIQFTYGPRAPLMDETLEKMGLTAAKGSHKIWLNFPPAQVYVLKRKGE